MALISVIPENRIKMACYQFNKPQEILELQNK